MERLSNKRKVSPEKVVKILAQNGTEISLEQAKLVLDLMYKFAEIALKPHMKAK